MATVDLTFPEEHEATLEAERLLASFDLDVSIGRRRGGYSASCYWPNNDVVRDVGCYGSAPTLAEALRKMEEKVREAEAAGRKLKTAAECKEAVLDLIREHDAHPASFRDAVDSLNVA